MNNCTFDALETCKQYAHLVSDPLGEPNCLSEWLNFSLTLLAVLFAGISAWAAWHANKSAQQQANREHFDRIYGDKFHTTLKKVRADFRPIKSQLLSSNISPEKVEGIKGSIRLVQNSTLYTESLSIDEAFKLKEEGSLQNLCDEIEEKLMAISGYIENQEGNWHQRANGCATAVEDVFGKMNCVYLKLRNAYKPL